MNIHRNARWVFAALAPALLTACTSTPESSAPTTTGPAASGAKEAGARVSLATADGAQAGTVTFTPVAGGTEVEVKLSANKAVEAGRFHGIHVHANDDPANGEGCKADPATAPSTWFTAVDGHLKSGITTHAEHTGDLPPLLVRQDGKGDLRFTTDRFTAADVVDKAVVVHAKADNFNVPAGTLPDQYTANAEAATTKTAATGNAGDRMACGLITKG